PYGRLCSWTHLRSHIGAGELDLGVTAAHLLVAEAGGDEVEAVEAAVERAAGADAGVGREGLHRAALVVQADLQRHAAVLAGGVLQAQVQFGGLAGGVAPSVADVHAIVHALVGPGCRGTGHQGGKGQERDGALHGRKVPMVVMAPSSAVSSTWRWVTMRTMPGPKATASTPWSRSPVRKRSTVMEGRTVATTMLVS